MKKSIISMMLIGMMMLGTGTSFGSTKVSNSPKKEIVVKNQKKQDNCDCKTCRDLVKKHKTPKKKGHCTCKNCKPVVKKQTVSKQPTCKIQPKQTRK